MKRILILSQFFPPEMEPSGFMLKSLSSHLVDKNFEVSVLSGFANFPSGKFLNRRWFELSRRSKTSGVNHYQVYVFPSDNKSNRRRIVNYTSYLVSGFLRAIFMKKPDVIIATSPPIFVALLGLLLSKIWRVPLVLDVRDIWPESAVQMGNLRSGSPVVKLLEAIEVLLYRNAAKITVATPGMVKIVRDRIAQPEKDVSFIPCAVNIPKYYQPKNRTNDCFSTNKFNVLYAGLHGHAQNLNCLLDVADRLQGNEDIHFTFVGDGPEKSKLQEIAKIKNLRNVTFMNPVSKEEIGQFYLGADVAIVPLMDLQVFKTVFPSKTFELMAFGVPIILGVGGQIEELAEKNKAALCVEPDNVSMYEEAILRLYENPDLRLDLSKSARSLATTQFSYDTTNPKFGAVIEQTLNS